MIIINIEKAKVIGHSIRRAARSEEFAPLDDAIAKSIPGTDLQLIESQREEIRARYAAMQSAIDAARDAREIKGALGGAIK